MQCENEVCENSAFNNISSDTVVESQIDHEKREFSIIKLRTMVDGFGPLQLVEDDIEIFEHEVKTDIDASFNINAGGTGGTILKSGLTDTSSNTVKFVSQGSSKKDCKRSLFICNFCGHNASRKDHLQLHIRSVHLKERPFICEICGFRASQKNNLSQHKLSKHSYKNKPFRCDLCDYETILKSKLDKHKISKHKKLKFNSCKVLFKNQVAQEKSDVDNIQRKILVENQVDHEKSELSDTKTELVVGCFGSQQLLEHITDISNHEVKTETDGIEAECNSGMVLESESNHSLYNAKKSVALTNHSNLHLLICNFCDYNTTRNCYLQLHIKSVHLKEKPFQCDICEYKASQKNNLLVHKLSKHSKVKPFRCDSCDYQTILKSRLEKHKISKHKILFNYNSGRVQFEDQVAHENSAVDNIISDTVVESQVNHKTSAQVNIKSESMVGRFDSRLFKDVIEIFKHEVKIDTDQSFSIKAGFNDGTVLQSKLTDTLCNTVKSTSQASSKKHSKQNFICNFCGHNTSRKGHLQLHIRSVHLNERPFICEICGFRASQKNNLSQHKLSKHSHKNKPFRCDSCDYQTILKSKLDKHTISKHKKLTLISSKVLFENQVGQEKSDVDNIKRKILIENPVSHEKGKLSNIKTELVVESFGSQQLLEDVTDISNHEVKNETDGIEAECSSGMVLESESNHIAERSVSPTNQSNLRLLICDFCDYNTTRNCYLQLHIKSVHLKEKPFICENCGYKTSQKSNLLRHKLLKHSKDKPFKCFLCDYQTIFKGYLEKHKIAKHKKLLNYNSCRVQDQTAHEKSDLDNIIRDTVVKSQVDHKTTNKDVTEIFEHEGKVDTDPSFSIKARCNDGTTLKTKQPDTLRNTVKSVSKRSSKKHSIKSLFICEFCDHKSHAKSHLQLHISSVHLKERPFICEICGFRASKKNNLSQHKLSKHSHKNKPFRCDLCDYETILKSKLDKHTISKHKKLKSNSCKVQFKNQVTPGKSDVDNIKRKILVENQVNHENTKLSNIETELVVGSFVSQQLLEDITEISNHEVKTETDGIEAKSSSRMVLESESNHTLINTEKSGSLAKQSNLVLLICDFCDYNTTRNSYLQSHIRSVHLKEKPFQCEICGYKASQKYNLIQHKLSKHSKVKPFRCDSCDYQTILKSRLEKHKISKHKILFNYNSCRANQVAHGKSYVDNVVESQAGDETSEHANIKSESLGVKFGSHQFFEDDIEIFEHKVKSDTDSNFEIKVEPYNETVLQSTITSKKGKSVSQRTSRKRGKRSILTCHLCGYNTPRKCNLRLHIRSVHLKEKPFACEICGFKASQKNNLLQHKLSKHCKVKPFRCDLCDYQTFLKRTLEKHKLSKHKKLFSCDLCDYKAVCVSNLSVHIESNHSKENWFKCELCDYTSATRSHISSHVKYKHSGNKPHNCDTCEYSTTQKTRLKHHIMFHHQNDKPFKCELCTYRAVRQIDLQQHVIARHTTEKPFRCELCNYGCVRKSSLKEHIMTAHHGEKPFKCGTCDFRTIRKSYLLQHMRNRHSEKEPLTCELCDYSTTQKSYLIKHKLFGHANEIV